LRGRSAAAAALSMPKDAAVTVRNFSIVNPLLFEPHLRRSRIRGAGAAPPDDCSDFHRCTGKMPQPRPPHNQKGSFPSVLRSLFPRLLHKHHVSRQRHAPPLTLRLGVNATSSPLWPSLSCGHFLWIHSKYIVGRVIRRLASGYGWLMMWSHGPD